MFQKELLKKYIMRKPSGLQILVEQTVGLALSIKSYMADQFVFTGLTEIDHILPKQITIKVKTIIYVLKNLHVFPSFPPVHSHSHDA